MRINPLDRALELAEKAQGGVAPRPPVGAVVVQDGAIVGEGATTPRPGPHAEVVALDQAGERANGATLYCTLEPHAFQGATPPCTDAIVAAGIATVVSPLEDPNPRVSGNGFQQLKAAGVEVVRESSDEGLSRAELLIEGFAHSLKKRRPLVTLKIASSLDGKIATRTGDSRWITSQASRARVHEMRRQADAVITGIGTVLADNPRLTARDDEGKATGRPLLRVVVDSNGRMPPDAALLGEPGEVLWVVGDDAEVESNTLAESVTILKSSRKNGKVDLAVVIGELGTRGLHNVMIEAGGKLAGAFVQGGFVDKVAAFIAPTIIGGPDASSSIAGPGITSLGDALVLERITHTVIGGDILIEGYVRGK
ncbi:MAG: bifunctional diaminohydroxyphosphoribosylaminopyrimidine deaminase/5-amino-6-(5-phosphoribosylamino)uracil reductase RibD [Chloroflexi bacterium]|nr:bifunctional diaminohydroxyphosphoribosylaminopyrimidine deaminase/5-amino-6-(5-phosphoribosylamino)uracil reductase RibD [Chloroflexota bacterium]